jgi:Disulphide bond corrector protein DsbC.
MNNRTQLILILACVVGALGFVGYQVFRASSIRTYAPEATFEERARLKEFTSSGVHVVVFMESDSKGQPLLRATFTPTAQGFHVYSKDLDPKTTDGLGMATRLELLSHPSIRAAGQLFADRAVESHHGLDIYPDGPVSLRLPIQFVGADTNLAAQVAVSYMACKTDGVCLRPVERQILDVQIISR